MGEVLASVRAVIDPSKTAGEDVVGATDIATEGSTPASPTAVDSIEADVMGDVVINVGVFAATVGVKVGELEGASVGQSS